jgi:hypothetical protein
MPISEILETAIERLQTNGWTQGKYVNFDGSQCMRGAIHNMNKSTHHCDLTPEGYDAERILASVIHPEYQKTGFGCVDIIVRFNDNPETTKEMVIDKMTEAAKVARNMGE